MHTHNLQPPSGPTPTPPLAPGDPAYGGWHSELLHFLSIKNDRFAQPHLRSQFSALHNHQIIDTDPDLFLSHRMDTLHPNENAAIKRFPQAGTNTL